MIIADYIEKMSKNIIAHQEDVLQSRCIELGIPVPTKESISKMRFNPFLSIEKEGFGTYYYYNDGTAAGKFIVGFERIEEYNGGNLNFKITFHVVEVEPEHLKIK